MRSKLNLLYLIVFIIILVSGCGSDMNTSSNDTGSAAFSLKWETPQNQDNMSLRAKGEAISELSYAPIDCTALGVSTVSANVYDSGGTYITSGGPWNCTDHSGTITGISAGINRMITVSGKDSSNRIIYNGQITGVTIDKDQTTNAGQITMTYVANDTTAPTDGILSASAGNQQVSLSWSGFSDSGSGLGSYKLVYSTTSTPSSCSSGTQMFTGTGTSYTHTGLTNNTTYYYRVCATDNAGNTSNGSTNSGTPTSSGGTTTADTTAPTSPSISINSGAASTTSTSVTLTLSASDSVGVTGYYASETSTTPSASATGWTTVTSATSYSGSVSFTLSSVSGTKTVYAWYRDSAGNVSAVASDSITLSTPWSMLKLPDTGQTTSYTTTFGEDHDYTINSPSYTDNGNGTITDNVTGLMWQKEDDNTTRTWTDAGTYCDSLTLGGYSDWRLPSKKELISIVNYGAWSPAINATYFPNTDIDTFHYWLSTTYASSSTDAWNLNFYNGDLVNGSKSGSYHVRCVRGEGQTTTKSFTDNGNGTVTDNDTKLMWQKGEGGSMAWESALTYCENLSLTGYSDWRLPNIKELESITDDSRYSPAIDTTYFPNAYSSGYWASTTFRCCAAGAWGVGFGNGGVANYSYEKSNNGYVRCVRAGQ